MRRRVMRRALVLISAMGAVATSAHAGPYTVSVAVARAVRIEATVSGSRDVTVSLTRLEGIDAQGVASILPPPATPQYTPYADAPGGVAQAPRYEGCITFAGSPDKSGCAVQSAPLIEFGPAMNDGKVSFSVRTASGEQVTANIQLTGGTGLVPVGDGAPRADPANPLVLGGGGLFGVWRDATITGSVRIDGGPGAITGTKSAQMFQGVASDDDIALNALVCLTGQPCLP